MQGSNSPFGSNSNDNKGGLSWSMPPATPSKSQSSLPMSSKSSTSKSESKSKAAAQVDSTGKLVGLFAAGVLVGGLLVGGWYSLNPSATPANLTTGNTNNTQATGNTNPNVASNVNLGASGATTQANAGTVVVSSPVPAGNILAISDATVSAPTWIAVYELRNGQPGKALGATMFFPQYNGRGGSITLLRATEAGKSYVIGQRIDDGDRVYETRDDKLVIDGSGSPVWVTFTAR